MKSKSYFSKSKKEKPKPKVKAEIKKVIEPKPEPVVKEEPKVEEKPAHECPCCKNRCLCCNHLSATVTDRCTCRCKTEASHKI